MNRAILRKPLRYPDRFLRVPREGLRAGPEGRYCPLKVSIVLMTAGPRMAMNSTGKMK